MVSSSNILPRANPRRTVLKLETSVFLV
jgi:hypothetical protein